VGVIAVVLVATLSLATAALFFVKRTMQGSISNEQFERTTAIASALDQKFISRRILLRTFSKSVEIHDFGPVTDVQPFLVSHLAELKESFDNVAFFDRQGNLVANLNDAQRIGKVNIADRDYFKETVQARASVISQPFRNRLTNLAQITITQPVFDRQGEIRWVLSGVINLQEQNFLGELSNTRFGKTGYMFITNTDGIVIDHPRKTRILNPTNAEGGANPVTDRAIAGFEGKAEGMNRVGVYGLYAFKRLQQTNWVVGTIYPRSEAFVEIDAVEHLAWAGALLLTALAGALGFAVLHTQLQPLTRLHDHMQASRERTVYLPMAKPAQQQEIAEMTQTFDSLMVERQLAQHRIEAQETYLRDVLRHAPDAFISIGTAGEITEWNRQAQATFGWTRSEVLGKNLASVLIPQASRDAHAAGLSKFVHSGEGPVIDQRIEVTALHKDGHEIPIELSVAAVRQGTGFVANAFLRDITSRKAAQALLAASEKRVRDIADHVPALIGYFDAGLNMHFANGPARKLFRIDPSRSYDLRTALGDKTFAQHAPYLPQVLSGQQVSFEGVSELDGRLHYQAHMVPDHSPDGTVKGMYIMTFDVSKLKQAEAQLIELSNKDPLTDLPNRRRFLEKLEEALARSKRAGRAMALLYLDIDSFKQINDTHGHAVGDAVLVEFSRRLVLAVRETDTVARLAGDEFVVLLEGLNGTAESELVAGKIVASMQVPMTVESHVIEVTSSVGVAVLEGSLLRDGPAVAQLGAEELILRADKALYEAKRNGRNRYALYRDGMG
jgi:diguanylate cyclase (GGDEF)-like protein/PAS domain S-box-containing protein